MRISDWSSDVCSSDLERELKLLDTAAPALALPVLPVGERADILRRRPDVLAAERQLAASTADIGLATAELFPKLSIGAGGGFQALSPGAWFDGSSARFRSERRGVGKEGGRTCRSRWAQCT